MKSEPQLRRLESFDRGEELRRVRTSQTRLIFAGLIGNTLEWYDFSIYGYFAAMIGRTFFPSHNPTASLLAAFGVFSVGFLTRPFGALLFGYIGDRYGREKALTISILAMAVPTCATGLLPGYERIGVTASVLMVLLRLVQGLSAGGEYTTSIVFLAERAGNQRRRGLMASTGLFGSIAGGMLGSGVGTALTFVLPNSQVSAWGWRLPFIAGIALAFVGFLIRRDLQAHGRRKQVSLRRLLRAHWRLIVQVGGFELLEAIGFYTVFIYLATYMSQVVGAPENEALAATTISMAFVLIVIPLAATLSDTIGRKPVLLTAAVCAALFSWPLFRLMHQGNFISMLLAQLGLAAIVGLYEGATPATAAEAFPASARCTGVALAFNICMTLFGGTTPMVATWLIARSGSAMAPSVYLIAAAIISGFVILTLRETAKKPLRGGASGSAEM